MRKGLRKTVSLAVAFAMAVTCAQGAMPGKLVQADETTEVTDYGVSNPRVESDGSVTWDCVYFGSYPQSAYTPKSAPTNPVSGETYTDSDGTKMLYKEWKDDNDDTQGGYFKYEPIKWRVLSVDGDDAFLLADQNLDVLEYKEYNAEEEEVTWENCTLRSWLNGYSASSNLEGTDYTSDNFLDKAFSSAEQAAISTTAVVNEDNPKYGTKGGDDTSDQIYLLSIGEVTDSAYGFSSDVNDQSIPRETANTAYVAAGGEVGSPYMAAEDHTNDWWLRSSGGYSSTATFVNTNGKVNQLGYYVYHYSTAVRPALHLNLNDSFVWSVAKTVLWKESWDCVYFGNYPQGRYTPKTVPENPVSGETYTDSDGTRMLYKEWEDEDDDIQGGYFKYEPIKWRVLSINGSDAFLLADQNLDAQDYDTSEEFSVDTTWETCTLRSWLNGYGASSNQEAIDYTSNNFLDTAFSLAEQAAISTTTVVNEDNPLLGAEGGNDTSDQVYLLSMKEVMNISYGFSLSMDESVTRKARNSAYVLVEGDEYFRSAEGRTDSWWLRSPGYFNGNAMHVDDDGSFDQQGCRVNENLLPVRPALHLNLNISSVWVNAGKVSSDGSKMEQTSTLLFPTATPSPSGGNTGVSVSPAPSTLPGRSSDSTSIKPKKLGKVTGIKVKAKKKAASVQWKKVSGAKGYQIQYSTNKKFKKASAKTTSKTKLTLKKLKKKKYYIRVRAYRMNGKTKVWGKWSSVKKVKVKK